jgi:gamma-glutamyl:cysteine ligase YbdK (ATP-grasp superfamily)
VKEMTTKPDSEGCKKEPSKAAIRQVINDLRKIEIKHSRKMHILHVQILTNADFGVEKRIIDGQVELLNMIGEAAKLVAYLKKLIKEIEQETQDDETEEGEQDDICETE